MSKYKLTHTNMSGHKTVKVLTAWGIFWQFSLFVGEKVEIEAL